MNNYDPITERIINRDEFMERVSSESNLSNPIFYYYQAYLFLCEKYKKTSDDLQPNIVQHAIAHYNSGVSVWDVVMNCPDDLDAVAVSLIIDEDNICLWDNATVIYEANSGITIEKLMEICGDIEPGNPYITANTGICVMLDTQSTDDSRDAFSDSLTIVDWYFDNDFAKRGISIQEVIEHDMYTLGEDIQDVQ